MDVHRRFDTALNEITEEWKKQSNVKGIFTFGSYVRGTATLNSDLDICIVWEGEEAPVELMAEQSGVLIDMNFITVREIQEVIEENSGDAFKIAEIIGRLKYARVIHDTDGLVKKWQTLALKYMWADDAIEEIKDKVGKALGNAVRYAEQEDSVSAIHELRCALLDIGRVILMKNNVFTIIKSSEILSELRMLDPLTYQLFLRTFKLKALEETELLEALEKVKQWLDVAMKRYEGADPSIIESSVVAMLIEVQRQYHGSLRLTMNGEYELAVLEMQQAISYLGQTLLELSGKQVSDSTSVIESIREHEKEFYEKILVELSAFDFQPKGIKRGIGEAQFIAQRI